MHLTNWPQNFEKTIYQNEIIWLYIKILTYPRLGRTKIMEYLFIKPEFDIENQPFMIFEGQFYTISNSNKEWSWLDGLFFLSSKVFWQLFNPRPIFATSQIEWAGLIFRQRFVLPKIYFKLWPNHILALKLLCLAGLSSQPNLFI